VVAWCLKEIDDRSTSKLTAQVIRNIFYNQLPLIAVDNFVTGSKV